MDYLLSPSVTGGLPNIPGVPPAYMNFAYAVVVVVIGFLIYWFVLRPKSKFSPMMDSWTTTPSRRNHAPSYMDDSYTQIPLSFR